MGVTWNKLARAGAAERRPDERAASMATWIVKSSRKGSGQISFMARRGREEEGSSECESVLLLDDELLGPGSGCSPLPLWVWLWSVSWGGDGEGGDGEGDGGDDEEDMRKGSGKGRGYKSEKKKDQKGTRTKR